MSSILLQDYEDYQALVDYCVSGALTQGLANTAGNNLKVVTISYNGKQSQSSGLRGIVVATSTLKVDVYVGYSAPTAYVRGTVWLDINVTSNTYRRFCVSTSDAPDATTWHPLATTSEVIQKDVALKTADTSVLASSVGYTPPAGGIPSTDLSAGVQASLGKADSAAPLNSPAFTGAPTVPTATVGDNGTNIANTAFVQIAIGNLTGSIGSVVYTAGRITSYVANGVVYTVTYNPTTGQPVTVSDGTTTKTVSYNANGSFASMI